MEDSAREIERIRAAYRERDAASEAKPSAWLDLSYRLQLHELEWALLEELGTAGVDPAGGRVLEVGCGAGYFLNRFLEYGAAHAAGIDLMEERISRASERYPRLELVAGDASRLPWADESFDLVTQFTCLSSVLDAGVRQAIASEMWRVLAPGGAVVSYDVRPTPPVVRALARLASLRAGRDGVAGTPIAPVGADEITRWFPARAIRFRSVGLYPELGRVLARRPLLAQLAARLPALRIHMLAVAKKDGHARM